MPFTPLLQRPDGTWATIDDAWKSSSPEPRESAFNEAAEAKTPWRFKIEYPSHDRFNVRTAGGASSGTRGTERRSANTQKSTSTSKTEVSC